MSTLKYDVEIFLDLQIFDPPPPSPFQWKSSAFSIVRLKNNMDAVFMFMSRLKRICVLVNDSDYLK